MKLIIIILSICLLISQSYAQNTANISRTALTPETRNALNSTLGKFMDVVEINNDQGTVFVRCEKLDGDRKAKCETAYNDFMNKLNNNDDEDKENRQKAEQECKSAIEKFDTARTEMIETCTAGMDCEQQVRNCLECQNNPEYCEYFAEESDEKQSAKQERINALDEKYRICPIMSTQYIDKTKETFDELKEKKSEKTAEVQEAMQELIQKRNKDKVEIEELENELLEKQKQLTQAMQDRTTLMQEAELEVKQKVAELDSKIEQQQLKIDEAQMGYAEKKEELIDAETEIQVSCYDQANAKLQANRERSLGALANNRTLLQDTNQFLTQASRRLSTNQNAIFNKYFTACWTKDKRTALQRNGLKRKEKLLENQFNKAMKTIEKSITSMQDQRKLLVEQAGLAVQKAAISAERKISNIQSEMMALQRKIASKKQENQTTMAADAQKLMHNQQQLSNLSKEADYAQKVYDLHGKYAAGESTEPGEINKAISKYRTALDKAGAAVRSCSGNDGSYGDCSTALDFLERSDLDDTIPVDAKCESSSAGGSNGSTQNRGNR